MSISAHPEFIHTHQAGSDCPACWDGFPRPCRCGGQIHAELGDENAGGDYWLRRWCSACGIDWDYPITDPRAI